LCLDVVLGRFLELSLQGHDLGLEPSFIQVLYLVHLVRCLTQVNKRKILYVAESFPGSSKVLRE
jgi:hypothetical protein